MEHAVPNAEPDLDFGDEIKTRTPKRLTKQDTATFGGGYDSKLTRSATVARKTTFFGKQVSFGLDSLAYERNVNTAERFES